MAKLVGQLAASSQLFKHLPVLTDHQGDYGDTLIPVLTEEALVFGSGLVTTQRYRGKTNERLTRTMLNIALASAGLHPAKAASLDPRPTVLDPMCGRGTTLNWALAYGLHGVGIDLERPALDQYAIFIETWAKRARLPHKMQRYRPGNGDLRNATFEVAPDRAAFKAGQTQRISTFIADAGDPAPAIAKRSVDVIVADLPYGIQHRGAEGGRAGNSRPGNQPEVQETSQLLERVLGNWARWLKPTGAICLAWNTKRASRRDVGSVLAAAGFTPVTAPGGFSMRHVVDATIDRDVIVAKN